MAKLRVFVVFDSKVGAYMQPFFARASGEALRSWDVLVNDGQSAMSKFPADFTLLETGTFDDETGRFEQHEVLRSVATALETKRSAEAPADPVLSFAGRR